MGEVESFFLFFFIEKLIKKIWVFFSNVILK